MSYIINHRFAVAVDPDTRATRVDVLTSGLYCGGGDDPVVYVGGGSVGLYYVDEEALQKWVSALDEDEFAALIEDGDGYREEIEVYVRYMARANWERDGDSDEWSFSCDGCDNPLPDFKGSASELVAALNEIDGDCCAYERKINEREVVANLYCGEW